MSRSGDNRISPQGEQLDTKERETKVPQDGIEYNDSLFINALMEFESLLNKSKGIRDKKNNIGRQERSLKRLERQKKITTEEAQKQKQTMQKEKEEIENIAKVISQEGIGLCQKYSIEAPTRINSGTLGNVINKLITKFYKKTEFEGFMSFDITPELKKLIIPHKKRNQTFYNTIMGIATNVQKNVSRDESHELRIKKYLMQDDFNYPKDSVNIKPTGMGKNSSFIVDTPDGRKFVKACGYGLVGLTTEDGSIHPNELFLYKVLEYINFGPKTYFLMENGASGSIKINSPSVVAHGNYIMTDEVPNLLLDTDETEQESINVEAYAKFKNSQRKEDAIEISAASLVKGLLSINDVYPNNGENYGLSEQKDRTKFMFIDHTPGINGVFSGNNLSEEKINNYSPRTSMSAAISSRKNYGNLSDLSASHNRWQKHTLARDVHKRVFSGEDGALPINEAIQKAQKDINNIIEDYPENFSPFTTETGEISSQQKLQFYVDKISKNIENYMTTNYAKLGQSGGDTERI